MSSIVNIFDNLLKYNDKNVFIIMDIHNNIWFNIKDILKLLDYTGSNKFTRIKGVNDENICKMKYIQIGTLMSLSSNMHPNTVFINEAGLYQLLSNSHKKWQLTLGMTYLQTFYQLSGKLAPIKCKKLIIIN